MSALRVGMGHDTHRLVGGKPLVLGGVVVPFDRGLDGHSDADVLLHALVDALLGAIGAGDIGEWFPNTDPQWRGANSRVFLEAAHAEVRNRGFQIVNLDCTIHAERPKLSAFKRPIAEQLAALLGAPVDRINVKAKSGELVGPVGRQEAISADVVVLLESVEAKEAQPAATPRSDRNE